jgi:iron complex outermembrane receptor protein
MRPSYSLRVAVVAMLAAAQLHHQAQAQEKKVEEVVVTSTALRENPLEVAQPTSVIAGDELRRQIAASIGETLGGELGVSSTYFGPSASRPVIRGLGGYRVQVLQDGSPALDVSSLSQDHAVSIESVVSQQIEIIKGPAALLYGSGAAGGLVNVVTTRIPRELAKSPVSGAAELRGDTATEEQTGALSLDGGVGALAFHADYFDRQSDDVKIPGFAQSDALRRQLIDAGEEPNDIRDHIANSASDTKGGAIGASLVGDAGFGGASWSRYESMYGIPAEETAFIDMKQDRFDARGDWNANGAWLNTLHLSGAYSDYTHTEFESPAVPGTIFNQNSFELRAAADHHWSSDWRGTIGAQYVDVDFAAVGEEAFVPASIMHAQSVFAFEERHFDRWTLELGARAENQKIEPSNDSTLLNYDETAFNASVGFVFKLTEDRALALNVTRTQRHPQAAELYANGAHIAAGRMEIGDPNLDMETAYTADVSLRSTGEGIRWTLNGFYNEYDNYIFLNPTGEFEEGEEGSLPIFDYGQARAKLYGYEAEVIFPLLGDGDASLELRLASDYVRGKLDDGGNLPQIPPLRVGAGLHYETGPWHAGAEAFYNTKQDDVIANELPTDGYTIVSLDLSYRLPLAEKHLLLFARGSNLLDEEARLATSPLKDIAPLPGRSFHIGARAEF